jgi:hypothetical protein
VTARASAAFHASTGVTLADAEASYWKRRTFWNRWVPIVGSSAGLWTLITALALVAFQRRRARDARLRELWEEEERALAELEAERDRQNEREESDEIVN